MQYFALWYKRIKIGMNVPVGQFCLVPINIFMVKAAISDSSMA
jgi:hypothetical protein